MGGRGVGGLAAAHLPLHELGEGAVGVGGEILVGALLGDVAVRGEDDDAVGAFDGREAVRDRDGRVVAFQQRGESRVDERFRFGVERRGCCGGGVWVSDVLLVGEEGSGEEVPSSRISMSGFLTRALAMAMRCFWPPESCAPRAPTDVSSPSG